MPEENGWNEWSRHVLKELDRLGSNVDIVKQDIHEIKTNFSKVAILEEQSKELSHWRHEISNVCSPGQLKELMQKVDCLQSFKIRAITVFTFIQIGIGVAIGVISLI